MKRSRDPQIKMSLSNETYGKLKEKATTMGMTMAAYVRILVINDLMGREMAGSVAGADKTIIEVVNKCETPEKRPRDGWHNQRRSMLRKKTVKVADVLKYI